MSVKLGQMENITDIKNMIKQELVMDSGIDLLLKDDSTGDKLTSVQQVADLVRDGAGITVEFIEVNPDQEPD